MAGMHPIVELMTVNFSLLALDQILDDHAEQFAICRVTSSIAVVIHLGNRRGTPAPPPALARVWKEGKRTIRRH